MAIHGIAFLHSNDVSEKEVAFPKGKVGNRCDWLTCNGLTCRTLGRNGLFLHQGRLNRLDYHFMLYLNHLTWHCLVFRCELWSLMEKVILPMPGTNNTIYYCTCTQHCPFFSPASGIQPLFGNFGRGRKIVGESCETFGGHVHEPQCHLESSDYWRYTSAQFFLFIIGKFRQKMSRSPSSSPSNMFCPRCWVGAKFPIVSRQMLTL